MIGSLVLLALLLWWTREFWIIAALVGLAVLAPIACGYLFWVCRPWSFIALGLYLAHRLGVRDATSARH